ncbi:hypothetical protein UFOVP182_17 [uncultured Caudovirales phage]|uniref:Uncharacterized protein n=1 Tax=uncultured Caudovirales phage TaxID=2100421 RepID=A0A6J7WDE9_9CAUD|nr:hypothetical protein UFOVP182_17 [uncultured Caudovirales phage]
METKLETEIHYIKTYFSNQIYKMSIDEDISDIIDMTIEELRDCVFHFDNINYILNAFCLSGVAKQQVQNDINKFISYYIISNMKREIKPDHIIQKTIMKAYILISRYRFLSEELFDIFIQFVNAKIVNTIYEMEEIEEFETCLNLQKSIKYLYDITKKPA